MPGAACCCCLGLSKWPWRASVRKISLRGQSWQGTLVPITVVQGTLGSLRLPGGRGRCGLSDLYLLIFKGIIHHVKEYNSEVFSVFRVVEPTQLIPERFSHPEKKPQAHWQSPPTLSLSPQELCSAVSLQNCCSARPTSVGSHGTCDRLPVLSLTSPGPSATQRARTSSHLVTKQPGGQMAAHACHQVCEELDPARARPSLITAM